MNTRLHQVQFNGGFLQRGFWLYVWEVTTPKGKTLYYVGRTGDSSSTKAQSPFNRMGQHLGFAENSNMLRRHLLEHDAEPERCTFRLVALGPLEPESKANSRHEHDKRRDEVAAMEKALAELMVAAGRQVMNQVNSRKSLDKVRFEKVHASFAAAFPVMAMPHRAKEQRGTR
jgi:hypothetical protein